MIWIVWISSRPYYTECGFHRSSPLSFDVPKSGAKLMGRERVGLVITHKSGCHSERSEESHSIGWDPSHALRAAQGDMWVITRVGGLTRRRHHLYNS